MRFWTSFIFGVGVVLWCAAKFLANDANPDLFGYFAFGKLFFKGDFPFHDPFSYLPVKDVWIYHEWLTGVIFQAIVERFGFTGLMLFRWFMFLCTVAMLLYCARLRKSSWTASFFMLLVASPVFTIGYSPVRAQIFTNLFFIAWVAAWERFYATGSRWLLWCTPALMVFWANLHGGFALGLGICGLYAFDATFHGWRKKEYCFWPIVIFALQLLATLINPYGVDYLLYMVDAVGLQREWIGEWISITTALQQGYLVQNVVPYFLALAVALGVILGAGRLKSRDALVLGVTFFAGFRHLRHSVFVFFSVAMLLPRYLDHVYQRLFLHKYKLSAIPVAHRSGMALLGGVLLVLACLELAGTAPLRLTIPDTAVAPPRQGNTAYPVQAADFLEKRDGGNILTEFEWGEYLLWRLPTAFHIAFDGRYETVFPETVSARVFAALNGEDMAFLDDFDHQLAVLRARSPLAVQIRALASWNLIYEDRGAVIFERRQIPEAS